MPDIKKRLNLQFNCNSPTQRRALEIISGISRPSHFIATAIVFYADSLNRNQSAVLLGNEAHPVPKDVTHAPVLRDRQQQDSDQQSPECINPDIPLSVQKQDNRTYEMGIVDDGKSVPMDSLDNIPIDTSFFDAFDEFGKM